MINEHLDREIRRRLKQLGPITAEDLANAMDKPVDVVTSRLNAMAANDRLQRGGLKVREETEDGWVYQSLGTDCPNL